LYVKNIAYNATVFSGLFDQWNNSFHRHRCENVFQV